MIVLVFILGALVGAFAGVALARNQLADSGRGVGQIAASAAAENARLRRILANVHTLASDAMSTDQPLAVQVLDETRTMYHD